MFSHGFHMWEHGIHMFHLGFYHKVFQNHTHHSHVNISVNHMFGFYLVPYFHTWCKINELGFFLHIQYNHLISTWKKIRSYEIMYGAHVRNMWSNVKHDHTLKKPWITWTKYSITCEIHGVVLFVMHFFWPFFKTVSLRERAVRVRHARTQRCCAHSQSNHFKKFIITVIVANKDGWELVCVLPKHTEWRNNPSGVKMLQKTNISSPSPSFGASFMPISCAGVKPGKITFCLTITNVNMWRLLNCTRTRVVRWPASH